VIPEIAEKVAEIVEKPVPDISPIEGKIMRKLVAKKWTRAGRVHLEVNNYTTLDAQVQVYEISRGPAKDSDQKPAFVSELDGEYTKVWQFPLGPGDQWRVSYSGKGGGALDVRGIPEDKKLVVDLDV